MWTPESSTQPHPDAKCLFQRSRLLRHFRRLLSASDAKDAINSSTFDVYFDAYFFDVHLCIFVSIIYVEPSAQYVTDTCPYSCHHFGT